MTPEDFVSTLDQLLKARHRPVAGCLATMALGRDKDVWTIITAKVVFHDSPVESRPQANYPSLRLVERWIEADEALSSLAGLLSGRDALDLEKPIRAENIMERQGPPEIAGVTGWPEQAYEARLSSDASRKVVPYGPLVVHGCRPYDNGAAAIVDWLQQERSWGGGEPRNVGTIHIILPDTRARIAKARWETTGAIIDIETNVPRQALQLQAVVHASGEQTLVIVNSPSPETTIQVPEGAKRVSLFLVHADTTLLGRVDLSSPGEDFLAGRGPDSPEQTMARDLVLGESEEVEFKPFIKLGDGKDNEVIKTVVAFSNTKGGRIYIGLRDDGVPQGETTLCQATNASLDEARAALVRRYEKLVRDKIKPVPMIEPTWIENAGEPVLAIRVLQVATGPFSTHENDIWVRKGSTNRKPDPITELPALYERAKKPQRAGFSLLRSAEPR